MPEIKLKFEPRDLWVGVYWNYRKSVESNYRRLEIYICLIPLFPIYLNWEWGWKNRKEQG